MALMAKIAKSAIRTPEAQNLLKRATEASGCTPSQLVDLAFAVDPALKMDEKKKSDAAIESLTGLQLGEKLKMAYDLIERQDRPSWFSKLADVQRESLVAFLISEEYTVPAIAKELGVADFDIQQIRDNYLYVAGGYVCGIPREVLIGRLVERKEDLYHRALADQDHSLCWRIEKDFVGILQDLGLLVKAPTEIRIHTEKEEKQRTGLLRIVEKKRAAEAPSQDAASNVAHAE